MIRSERDGKTTVFSLPRDDELGFLTPPNFNYPRRRAWPANSSLPIFPPLLKVEKERVFGCKKLSSLYFSIFHIVLGWNLNIFMTSFPIQLQTCSNQLLKWGKQQLETYGPINNKSNNQLEAIKEGRHAGMTQQQLSIVNKTQQSTNWNGREVQIIFKQLI